MLKLAQKQTIYFRCLWSWLTDVKTTL